MVKINSRAKGQGGEREIVQLLQPIIAANWGLTDVPVLTRNLVQTRNGGHDLIGLDFLALEIKRCETLQLDAWWLQTRRQAGAHAAVVKRPVMPVLLYRQSRKPWRCQMLVSLRHGLTTRADISLDAFLRWFACEVRGEHARIAGVPAVLSADDGGLGA